MLSRLGASHVFASLKRLALRGYSHTSVCSLELAALANGNRFAHSTQLRRWPRSDMRHDPAASKAKGGRPKGDPAAVRTHTIGVRVSVSEYEALRVRAMQMCMSPAQWLREAALSRRLPSPPVAAINRAQYVELARLSANLNQLARLANEGQRVTVADGLLRRMFDETRRLRLALLGVLREDDDR